MITHSYYTNWDYWELYHKVTFNGVAKTIYINEGETTIDIKQDIYSAWKEWVSLRDYAKFLPAIRTVGGDPTPTGYAGDIYFLMNGWQVVISHEVQLTGILYHDDLISPFIVEAGGGVISTVSNLALGVVNPAVSVREEMDNNSTKLIDTIARLESLAIQLTSMPSDIWAAPISTNNTAGSFGEFIQKKLLTFRKFIGLK